MFLYLFVASVVSIVIFHLYTYKKVHRQFDAAGLKYLPGVPIFGNVLQSIFLRRHFVHDLEEVYNAFPDEKYVGFIEGIRPIILVRDPEVMKIILIKDFDHFRNRKAFFPLRLDPLLGRGAVELRGDEWKTVRTDNSPAFTGARLKAMTPAMVNVSKYIIKVLKNSPEELDIQDFMNRYAGEAIMSAAFGFNQDAAALDNSPFFELGCATTITPWRRALSFVSLQYPILGDFFKILGTQMFPRKIHDFLRKAVAESIEYRMKNNLSISDYMDVLCKKMKGKPLDDIAGQVFFAFTASFGTAGDILSFCLHELTLNPEIQERMYQEIRTHEEAGGDLSMEAICGLKYLDCVFNEVSRRWSGAVMLDRVCTKPYLLPPPREGGKPYLVKPEDLIYNVVNPVHMDPKYFPDPETFDPERFSDSNKRKIKSFTFMPFGMGPRNCLGARLMTLQMKVMMYQMVLNFKMEKCEKTTNPIILIPDEMDFRPEGGSWMRLIPRC